MYSFRSGGTSILTTNVHLWVYDHTTGVVRGSALYITLFLFHLLPSHLDVLLQSVFLFIKRGFYLILYAAVQFYYLAISFTFLVPFIEPESIGPHQMASIVLTFQSSLHCLWIGWLGLGDFPFWSFSSPLQSMNFTKIIRLNYSYSYLCSSWLS